VLTRDQQSRLDEAVAQVTQLEFRELAFREFSVARDYYDGLLELDDADAAEALRATGEHGRLACQRLDLDAGSPPEALAARARERRARWAVLAADLGYNAATRRAIQIVLRSYEELIHQNGPAERACR
jgi:hypothetical protein